MKIYLGNLSKKMNDTQLNDLVTPFGKPQSASIATERGSGASRGFGFVEFASDDEAKAAIAGLDGKEVHGQTIKVNESIPKGGKPAAAPHS
jgi:cold-inducible RNA-binding protein